MDKDHAKKTGLTLGIMDNFRKMRCPIGPPVAVSPPSPPMSPIVSIACIRSLILYIPETSDQSEGLEALERQLEESRRALRFCEEQVIDRDSIIQEQANQLRDLQGSILEKDAIIKGKDQEIKELDRKFRSRQAEIDFALEREQGWKEQVGQICIKSVHG